MERKTKIRQLNSLEFLVEAIKFANRQKIIDYESIGKIAMQSSRILGKAKKILEDEKQN